MLVLAGCFMLLAGSAGTVIAAAADEAVDLARRYYYRPETISPDVGLAGSTDALAAFPLLLA